MINKCIVCGCTDGDPCLEAESGETCRWVNDDHSLCSACDGGVSDGTATQSVPVYLESLGGSLIDAARISVMGALALLPERSVVLVSIQGEVPTVEDCLREGLSWLDAARRMTIEGMPAPPTSLHVLREDAPNGIS